MFNIKLFSKLSQNYLKIIPKVISGIALSSMFVPGVLCSALVDERCKQLRNVLTVSGCDVRSFWLGTLGADVALLQIPNLVFWVSMNVFAIPDWHTSLQTYLLLLLYPIHLCLFSYALSFLFSKVGDCLGNDTYARHGLHMQTPTIHSCTESFCNAFRSK